MTLTAESSPPQPTTVSPATQTTSSATAPTTSSATTAAAAAAAAAVNNTLSSHPAFYFRRRTGQLNWRQLSSLNLTNIIEQTDITTLQLFIEPITFSNININTLNNVHDNDIIILIRLMQLTLEYLLNVQNYLLIKNEQNNNIINELKKNIIHEQEEKNNALLQVESIKRENKLLKKMIRSHAHKQQPQPHPQPPQHVTVGSAVFACPHCRSAFVSESYLTAHIYRRHPQQIIPPAQSSPPSSPLPVSSQHSLVDDKIEHLRDERIALEEKRLKLIADDLHRQEQARYEADRIATVIADLERHKKVATSATPADHGILNDRLAMLERKLDSVLTASLSRVESTTTMSRSPSVFVQQTAPPIVSQSSNASRMRDDDDTIRIPKSSSYNNKNNILGNTLGRSQSILQRVAADNQTRRSIKPLLTNTSNQQSTLPEDTIQPYTQSVSHVPSSLPSPRHQDDSMEKPHIPLPSKYPYLRSHFPLSDDMIASQSDAISSMLDQLAADAQRDEVFANLQEEAISKGGDEPTRGIEDEIQRIIIDHHVDDPSYEVRMVEIGARQAALEERRLTSTKNALAVIRPQSANASAVQNTIPPPLPSHPPPALHAHAVTALPDTTTTKEPTTSASVQSTLFQSASIAQPALIDTKTSISNQTLPQRTDANVPGILRAMSITTVIPPSSSVTFASSSANKPSSAHFDIESKYDTPVVTNDNSSRPATHSRAITSITSITSADSVADEEEEEEEDDELVEEFGKASSSHGHRSTVESKQPSDNNNNNDDDNDVNAVHDFYTENEEVDKTDRNIVNAKSQNNIPINRAKTTFSSSTTPFKQISNSNTTNNNNNNNINNNNGFRSMTKSSLSSSFYSPSRDNKLSTSTLLSNNAHADVRIEDLDEEMI